MYISWVQPVIVKSITMASSGDGNSVGLSAFYANISYVYAWPPFCPANYYCTLSMYGYVGERSVCLSTRIDDMVQWVDYTLANNRTLRLTV